MIDLQAIADALDKYEEAVPIVRGREVEFFSLELSSGRICTLRAWLKLPIARCKEEAETCVVKTVFGPIPLDATCDFTSLEEAAEALEKTAPLDFKFFDE